MLKRSCLLLIFSTSINQGKIPDDWRHAVYKGGNKSRTKPESYRPISLTSVTCKLMEHIIHSPWSTLIVIKPSVTPSMVFGSFAPASPNFCKLSTLSAHYSTTENKSTLFCLTLVKPSIRLSSQAHVEAPPLWDQRQHLQMDSRLPYKPNTTGCS